MSKQVPSVCRMVHYNAYGTPGGEYKPVPRAAVIAEVLSETKVTLVVLNPKGIFFTEAELSIDAKPGTWSWPPYAPHVPNHQRKPGDVEPTT